MVYVDDVELERRQIPNDIESKQRDFKGLTDHQRKGADQCFQLGFMRKIGIEVIVILWIYQGLRHLGKHILLRVKHRELL